MQFTTKVMIISFSAWYVGAWKLIFLKVLASLYIELYLEGKFQQVDLTLRMVP